MPKPEIDIATLNSNRVADEDKVRFNDILADYTKKTQALADDRREFEANKEKLVKMETAIQESEVYTTRLETYNKELLDANEAWVTYSNTNFTRDNIPSEDDPPVDDSSRAIKKDVNGNIMVERDESEKMKLMIAELDKRLKETSIRSEKQVSLAVQLAEMARTKDVWDTGRVLARAKTDDIDLETAWEREYHTELVEAEVTKRAEEKFVELKKSLHSDPVSGVGFSGPSVYTPPEDVGNKSYLELNDAFLQDLHSGDSE